MDGGRAPAGDAVTGRLALSGLRVRRGGVLVVDVERLDAAAGELVVIAGDAGSGKTALAAALAGAIDCDGEVRLDGVLLSGPPSRRRRGGLAAAVRDGDRVTGCTVAEALRLAAAGTRRAAEALGRFPQLGERSEVMAQLLSGGEQQLLQVACAWAVAPAVLVLDSPTVGLANDAAAAVAALARGEAERGATVLWLEADRRATPTAPRHVLVRGRLAPAAGSGPDAP